jgi:hypothetical protein
VDLDTERIVGVSDRLAAGARRLRVLTHLAWPAETRHEFLGGGADRLPEVSYPPFDVGPTVALVEAARRDLHDDGVVDVWLRRTADEIETTARMLGAAGSAAFHEHSVALYGAPRSPLPRTTVTPHDLADTIHSVLGRLVELEIGLTPPPTNTADDVAARLRQGLDAVFGDDAPPVHIVDDLSANAAASASRIRVRRDARFTDRDADQLLEHEAYIHVATALNGRRQPLGSWASATRARRGPRRGWPCSRSSRAGPRSSTGCVGSPIGCSRSRRSWTGPISSTCSGGSRSAPRTTCRRTRRPAARSVAGR